MLALDYDETYTRDPIFWDAVITKARKSSEIWRIRSNLSCSLGVKQSTARYMLMASCRAYGLTIARTGYIKTHHLNGNQRADQR